METSDVLQFLSLVVEKYKGAAGRGIVILGSLYLFFWVFKRPWMEKYRVATVGQAKAKPLREMFYTFTTYIVYAAAGATVAFVYQKTGYTKMYMNVADFGWTYTIASFFIFLFWSDTTFYWSHLLMHKNRTLYRFSHATHHQFVNVTPWAAYAFHTGEALINAGAFLGLMLLIPWHPVALLAFVIFSVAYNGMVHSGFDLFPKSWKTNPVMKWWNTPTHHIYHHQKSNCNYGFLFCFWDKVMGTEKLPEASVRPTITPVQTPAKPELTPAGV